MINTLENIKATKMNRLSLHRQKVGKVSKIQIESRKIHQTHRNFGIIEKQTKSDSRLK